MTAPRAREQADPPSPPDRLPPRRGGSPSSKTYSAAARPAGFARLAGARRGLVHSVRTLAAAALLAALGALALPATAQAETTDHFYLWTATMTVGENSGELGYTEDSYGSLSTDAKFNHPPFSPPPKHNFDPDYEFTATKLATFSDSGATFLVLQVEGLISRDTGTITLWIENTGFLLNDGAIDSSRITFNSQFEPDVTVPDLDWAEGDLVRVALTYERQLPSAPTNVRVTAPQGENGTLQVSWDEAVAGTFPIEYYLVEFRPGGDARRAVQSYVPSTRTSVQRTDLEPGVAYQVFVQALSGDGHGTQSATKTRVANAGRALRARFMSPPERHDGSGLVKLRVAFSEAIDESPENVGEHGVTCLVRFDNNQYSVAARAVGRPVDVRAYADRIVIRQDGEIVAEHPRGFGRGRFVYDPWHYVPVLTKKPGALRNGAPFKGWQLPNALGRLRTRLSARDDGDRQFVKVLAAVLEDGLEAVEAACAEALACGACSADVVLNILARQREPAPPASIPTPEGLRLRHQPVADCRRYDRLRGAGHGAS